MRLSYRDGDAAEDVAPYVGSVDHRPAAGLGMDLLGKLFPVWRGFRVGVVSGSWK